MPIGPGRIVPHILLMSAFQISNPVEAFIQMKIDDLAGHTCSQLSVHTEPTSSLRSLLQPVWNTAAERNKSMNLSLRNAVRLAVIATILLWFLSYVLFVGVGSFPGERAFWTLLLFVTIGIALANLIVQREFSRYRSAISREDLLAAQGGSEPLQVAFLKE
jgi:hypothetical protein